MNCRYLDATGQTKPVIMGCYGIGVTRMAAAWIEQNHDKEIVRKLNEALRKAEYKDELFKTCTSKTLDELWDGFIASLDKK